MQQIWEYIVNTGKNLSFPTDIIDIAFICIVVYLVLKFIRDTRAARALPCAPPKSRATPRRSSLCPSL